MNIPAKHLNGYASRLKLSREAKNLTQAELAQKADIQAMEVSHYESGRRLPGLLHAINISRALNVPIDWMAQEDPAWDEPSVTA